MLWIKGKPGAGKSTLMKHALRRCDDIFADHLIAAYFFHARGDVLEKTPLGMLRSIVFQLVDKDNELYEQLMPIFREKRYGDRDGNGQWQWQRPQLEDFLVSAVQRRPSQRPLLLLVDALDECTDGDVRSVVGFLESLSIFAVKAGATLRICLSSRHYPYVSMKRNLELTVEGTAGHCRDITTYISERLIGRDNEIEAEVRKRADGIFMWVVIVVSLLNKAYDDGLVEAMRKMLEIVPDDLEKVFDNLLSQDDASKAETIVLLQWVLLSQRPLQLEELYFGIMTATVPESIGRWDRSKVTHDAMQRRITSLSKGLIEGRRENKDDDTDDTSNGQSISVQFIHQSVNDFLFRNQRLQKLDTTLKPDPIRASHGRLWACCWQYIKQVNTVLKTKEDMKQLRRDYPFLLYTAKYIFDHAEKALAEEMVEGTILGDPMRQAISEWLQAQDHWFEWWKMFVRTSESYSDLNDNMEAGLLYIISLRGYQSLVRLVLVEERNTRGVNIEAGHFGTALQAASDRGDIDIVRMLLDAGADVAIVAGHFGTALQAASVRGDIDIVRMLRAASAMPARKKQEEARTTSLPKHTVDRKKDGKTRRQKAFSFFSFFFLCRRGS